MEKTKIICVVGATASGKTALAIEMAKKFNGEIISADSRQIYRRLDIGTNKDLSDYGQIKYHLIDIAPPGEKFTLFDWKDRAEKAIREITKRGKLPIIAGGTGLYVQSLIEGFCQQKSKIKNQNDNLKIKKYKRSDLDRKILKELQEIYNKIKISETKIDLNNPRRVIRAIERAQEGSLATRETPNFEVLQIAIDLPRLYLYEKIDKNVEKWFENGFLEEVRGLVESGVDLNWLKSIGLNYRLVSEFITNAEWSENDLEKLKQNIKYKTHALARRQLTWFRRFGDIKWVKNREEAKQLIEKFLKYHHSYLQ
ncbi:MAG: tRNA dimethylallyltransferase [candidate division WS2 bacterium ADurb.Bin280]|uniref:tRNA dimethylallyltransferase n=1 Tax=candidate division WS2 bacterium ADurb.Bin280 TaxID=1852829 RepID=A0A1V5SF86_9BACT|nr:MAG: tRNA dimethylallyltransferase [candidate division WS2 bacterium ADurb.Bin280]